MKLYAYVDETGQDTSGQLFIVAVVIVRGDGDPLRQALREVERDSRKLDKKWTKSRPAQREAYMTRYPEPEPLHGSLYYALHRHTSDYVDLTIQSTSPSHLEPSRAIRPDPRRFLSTALPGQNVNALRGGFGNRVSLLTRCVGSKTSPMR